MKRLTFYIIAAALAFSASCSKQEAETAPAQKEKEYATILYATFDEVASKTHLVDIDSRKNVPCWDLGDAIWVSNGTDVARAEVVGITGGTSATLGLSTKLSGDTFYAVYPYRDNEDGTYPYSVKDGKINIDIPTVQDGTFANANISAAVCSAGETLKFRNVTSLFKITSKLPSVTTITCSHANIAGNVTFTYGETSSAVTTGDAGEITVTPKGSAPYYIAVAPGITYAAGDVFATYNDKYSKKGKNNTTLARSKIYNLGFAGPEGGLSGEFTIDEDGHKVCFAKGNLYCKRSSPGGTDWTWQFYDEQYQYNTSSMGKSGYRDVSINELQKDLFCWNSVSTDPTSIIYNPDKTNLNNWGNVIDGDVWTTLSFNEYSYVLNNKYYIGLATWNLKEGQYRTNARYTKAQVCGVKGLLLFPDNFEYNTSTHEISINEVILKNVNISTTSYSGNTIDEAEWILLENAGLVFLPAAGRRQQASIYSINKSGVYWTGSFTQSEATIYSPTQLIFDESGAKINIEKDYETTEGLSVRLVSRL